MASPNRHIAFVVENTQDLFNRGKFLSILLSQLNVIVQNNTTIEGEELLSFSERIDRFIVDVDEWRNEVVERIGTNEVEQVIRVFKQTVAQKLIDSHKDNTLPINVLPFDDENFFTE